MKQLYFVRHGESLITTGDTWADVPGTTNDKGLTPLGRSQVRSGAKAARASGITFDCILCSPLQRTRETAAIIAEVYGFALDEIKYSGVLLEIQVGPELEDTSYAAFIAKYSYADFDKFKGAETIAALQKRASQALRLAKSFDADTVLIVSHSCFGRAFQRVIEGRPFTDEFAGKNAPLPYGEIRRLI